MIISTLSQSNKPFLTRTLSSLIRDPSCKMQLVKFIVVCMPLAILASPIEQHEAGLVDRKANPDGLVEVAGFTEKRDDPNQLFRRKSLQHSQGQTELFSSCVHVSDTMTPTRQHQLQYN